MDFDRYARTAVEDRRRREAGTGEVSSQMAYHEARARDLGAQAARSILANGGRPTHTVLTPGLMGYRVTGGFWSSWSMRFDRPVPRLFLVEDGGLVHKADFQCNGSGVWPVRGRPLTTATADIQRGPVIVTPTPYVLPVVGSPYSGPAPAIVAEPGGVLRYAAWDLEDLLAEMVAKALS